MKASLHALLIATIATSAPVMAQTSAKPPEPNRSEHHDFRVETVADRLDHPWGLAFLPDGRMLVTERGGRLRIVTTSGAKSQPLAGVPLVFAREQGGLLDVALSPRFAENRLVYLTYAEPRGGGKAGTAVARGRLVEEITGARLDEVQVIFQQQPAAGGGGHFGSRLAFAKDGRLFVTLGERYQSDRAQDLSGHLGKVVRIEADGSVPGDNPFIGRSDVRPELWSYGHRNPQSAAIHPETGKLWTVEHGPRGGDEINVPLAGLNYGWPVIGYGIDYSGAKLHASTHRPGMEQPIHYWVPSIAPSGMAFYTGDQFPRWKGNLFVGALAMQHLNRLELDGERIVREERLLKRLQERIRDVRQGPDGLIYLLTDHPDGRILRLMPAGN